YPENRNLDELSCTNSQRTGGLILGKGFFGPNGGSGGSVGGKVEDGRGTVGGNGDSGGSMVERGGGSLAKLSMDLKEDLGGGGFMVQRGRSSRELNKA
nr:hypothetical protein [Tanacetum cinerariifolium]